MLRAAALPSPGHAHMNSTSPGRRPSQRTASLPLETCMMTDEGGRETKLLCKR